MTDTATPARLEHPTLDALPEWPLRTIAVLAMRPSCLTRSKHPLMSAARAIG